MENNYFIKSNYTTRKATEKYEMVKDEYWVSERIKMSYYYQYSVYVFCRDLIKKYKLKSVLDIGCGPATKLFKLILPVCIEIYGIDQNEIISYCKKKYNLTTFFADDIEIPTLNLDKKFDLIICSDVIEHLNDPDKLIEYIKKFSHADTYIVISTPERDILRGKDNMMSPQKEHVREWNFTEFKEYLTSHKFKILMHKLVKAYKINFIPIDSIYSIINTYKNIFHLLTKRKKINYTQLILCKIKY